MTRLTRFARRLALATAVLALVLASVALAFTPRAGTWTGKAVQGAVLPGKNGTPTFSVRGSTLRTFTIRGAGAFCFTGYSVVTVYVPTVHIRGNAFSTTYHPIKGANVKFSGRFLSATRMKGKVVGSGSACDYSIDFVAHHA